MSATEITKIQFAPLETIDLDRLERRDAAEIEKLLCASSRAGGFFLDFSNVAHEAAKHLPVDVPKLIGISDEYFAQPLAAKMKDFREGQLPDRDRGHISYDELVSGNFKFPDVLDRERERFDRFMRLVQSAGLTMLACLSDALQLARDERFERWHKQDRTSESGLKVIYEPTFERVADWLDNTHTDTGTFTILFYDQVGLDVFDPETKTWAYAAVPPPDCAFVNLANAIQSVSRGRLHSPLHRVSQPADGFRKRYYLSYFLRPEHGVKEALLRGDDVSNWP
ncbi:hypothetical protein SLS56_011488 [Neofusicoccum ribis]|uniref:Isopenicillin N synthase-like Fe(2+) 2OG dioxygenase domain-containing protein n=1 Tax=Neofusicoccum ribis TaxID=45134 RepID=A0ABR3SBH7_9PEZI